MIQRASLSLLVALAPLLVVPACSKPSERNIGPAATTSASPPVTVEKSAAPAPPPAVSAAPVASGSAEPPVYPPRTVPGGMYNGAWVQPFEVVRDKGNLGLSYLDAMSRCIGYSKVLCSDSSWARACATDEKLSRIETWVSTGVGSNRFVTRGGEEAGCRARNVKEGTDLSPTRAAVCCDYDIGIKQAGKADELTTGTVRKLFAYYRALRDKDALTLAGLYEDKVTWLGKERTNAEIIKVHQESFQKDPAQWTQFDTCSVAGDKGDGGPEAKATVDCVTLFQRKGAVVVAMQRLIFSGNGKIKLIGDAETANMPAVAGATFQEKELKERVGILLQAD